MSKLGLVIVMLLIAGKSNAQNYPAPTNEPLSYFVLIQADDNQAFYVRLNGQLYPSSPAGHLILSRLHDSLYAISIGLPGQASPEKRYLLDIHRKDLALRLRQVNSKWELYDSQGRALTIVADPSATGRPSLAGVKKDDAFSQLMSAIVQDTAVMYNNYAATSDSAHPGAPTTSQTVPPSTHSDTTSFADSPTLAKSSLPMASSTNITHDTLTTFLAVSTPSVTTNSPTGDSSAHLLTVGGPERASPADTLVSLSTPGKTASSSPRTPTKPSPRTPTPTLTNAPPSSPTGVVKLSERKSAKSLHLVYTDHAADTKSDTIDILIPIDSPVVGTAHSTHISDPTRGASTRLRTPDTSHTFATGHVLHSDTSSNSATLNNSATPNSAVAPASPGSSRKALIPFVNSDCHAFATDYDVDKLRIRMLDVDKDDDRLLAARKVFKTKCFTTHQIRALSEVFATDAAKFKFLETAYPFCSDDNFPELVSLLADPVYTGRFRTMTDRH